MKRIVRTAIVAMSLLTIPLVSAQSTAGTEQEQITAVIKEIKAQQASIAENQAQIEAKLVALAEQIRIAKIYASRGGHK